MSQRDRHRGLEFIRESEGEENEREAERQT